jgi:hypothetical protein
MRAKSPTDLIAESRRHARAAVTYLSILGVAITLIVAALL